MDADVLNNKLESLAKCVKRIESKMPQNLVDFRSFEGYVSNLISFR